MGTVFQVPWARLESWPADLQTLHELGFKSAALALEEDSLTLEELSAAGMRSWRLILGTGGARPVAPHLGGV